MKRIVFVLAAILAAGLLRAERLAPERIDSARAAVWADWVAAQPEVLPQARPLDEARGASWVIPDSLEPHAVMDFFYGLKGDAEQYPLFLYLHGSGPRDMEWLTGVQLARIFEDSPSAYFIPRIPNEGEYYRWYQRGKQWAWERLLRAALASGRIDPDRIYLIGISEGGYGGQRLASFYADYLAGAGPMAGGEPLINAPAENLRNIAFSLRTGADDHGFYRDRLTGYTGAALDSLAVASPDDYPHWVELIPGCGHGIDYRPTPQWLRRFSRRPSPRRLTWENFPMDGRYRSGFGNLQVLERSNADESERTVYDLEIDADNNIRLRADLVSYECMERDPQWGIELKFRKNRRPARSGRVRIFLDETMVDFSRPVVLTVNGVEQFRGMLTLTEGDLRNSCAEFGDPRRLFPASVVAIF